MVFYNIVITKADTPISFFDDSTGTVYVSPGFSDATIFSFNGQTGKLDNAGEFFSTSLWNPPSNTYPSDTTVFQFGDCIHITNTADLPANLRVTDGGDIVDTLTLAPNNDTWLLWRGILSRFSDKVCCVHSETMVQTEFGFRPIKDLKKGDRIMNSNGKLMRILRNIKFVTTKEFVKIPAKSFNNFCPTNDLLIRPNHPILCEGKEILPVDLLNNMIKKVNIENPSHVYTLITNKPCFVNMNGVMVATWGLRNWNKRVKKDPSMIFWKK